MAQLANLIGAMKFPGKPVPQEIALKLIQRHRDTGGWANGQTRGIWFSKDDFISILAMIAEFEGDGMRVYIGRYPMDEVLSDTPDPDKYKDRLTVVFVPTRDGKQNVFDINQPPTASFSGIVPPPPPTGFNHGELEP